MTIPRMKVLKMTPPKRAEKLKDLISEGLALGFSSSLIGNFQAQLNEVEEEVKQEKAKRKAFFKKKK